METQHQLNKIYSAIKQVNDSVKENMRTKNKERIVALDEESTLVSDLFSTSTIEKINTAVTFVSDKQTQQTFVKNVKSQMRALEQASKISVES